MASPSPSGPTTPQVRSAERDSAVNDSAMIGSLAQLLTDVGGAAPVEGRTSPNARGRKRWQRKRKLLGSLLKSFSEYFDHDSEEESMADASSPKQNETPLQIPVQTPEHTPVQTNDSQDRELAALPPLQTTTPTTSRRTETVVNVDNVVTGTSSSTSDSSTCFDTNLTQASNSQHGSSSTSNTIFADSTKVKMGNSNSDSSSTSNTVIANSTKVTRRNSKPDSSSTSNTVDENSAKVTRKNSKPDSLSTSNTVVENSAKVTRRNSKPDSSSTSNSVDENSAKVTRKNSKPDSLSTSNTVVENSAKATRKNAKPGSSSTSNTVVENSAKVTRKHFKPDSSSTNNTVVDNSAKVTRKNSKPDSLPTSNTVVENSAKVTRKNSKPDSSSTSNTVIENSAKVTRKNSKPDSLPTSNTVVEISAQVTRNNSKPDSLSTSNTFVENSAKVTRKNSKPDSSSTSNTVIENSAKVTRKNSKPDSSSTSNTVIENSAKVTRKNSKPDSLSTSNTVVENSAKVTRKNSKPDSLSTSNKIIESLAKVIRNNLKSDNTSTSNMVAANSAKVTRANSKPDTCLNSAEHITSNAKPEYSSPRLPDTTNSVKVTRANSKSVHSSPNLPVTTKSAKVTRSNSKPDDSSPTFIKNSAEVKTANSDPEDSFTSLPVTTKAANVLSKTSTSTFPDPDPDYFPNANLKKVLTSVKSSESLPCDKIVAELSKINRSRSKDRDSTPIFTPTAITTELPGKISQKEPSNPLIMPQDESGSIASCNKRQKTADQNTDTLQMPVPPKRPRGRPPISTPPAITTELPCKMSQKEPSDPFIVPQVESGKKTADQNHDALQIPVSPKRPRGRPPISTPPAVTTELPCKISQKGPSDPFIVPQDESAKKTADQNPDTLQMPVSPKRPRGRPPISTPTAINTELPCDISQKESSDPFIVSQDESGNKTADQNPETLLPKRGRPPMLKPLIARTLFNSPPKRLVKQSILRNKSISNAIFGKSVRFNHTIERYPISPETPKTPKTPKTITLPLSNEQSFQVNDWNVSKTSKVPEVPIINNESDESSDSMAADLSDSSVSELIQLPLRKREEAEDFSDSSIIEIDHVSISNCHSDSVGFQRRQLSISGVGTKREQTKNRSVVRAPRKSPIVVSMEPDQDCVNTFCNPLPAECDPVRHRSTPHRPAILRNRKKTTVTETLNDSTVYLNNVIETIRNNKLYGAINKKRTVTKRKVQRPKFQKRGIPIKSRPEIDKPASASRTTSTAQTAFQAQSTVRSASTVNLTVQKTDNDSPILKRNGMDILGDIASAILDGNPLKRSDRGAQRDAEHETEIAQGENSYNTGSVSPDPKKIVLEYTCEPEHITHVLGGDGPVFVYIETQEVMSTNDNETQILLMSENEAQEIMSTSDSETHEVQSTNDYETQETLLIGGNETYEVLSTNESETQVVLSTNDNETQVVLSTNDNETQEALSTNDCETQEILSANDIETQEILSTSDNENKPPNEVLTSNLRQMTPDPIEKALTIIHQGDSPEKWGSIQEFLVPKNNSTVAKVLVRPVVTCFNKIKPQTGLTKLVDTTTSAKRNSLPDEELADHQSQTKEVDARNGTAEKAPSQGPAKIKFSTVRTYRKCDIVQEHPIKPPEATEEPIVFAMPSEDTIDFNTIAPQAMLIDDPLIFCEGQPVSTTEMELETRKRRRRSKFDPKEKRRKSKRSSKKFRDEIEESFGALATPSPLDMPILDGPRGPITVPIASSTPVVPVLIPSSTITVPSASSAPVVPSDPITVPSASRAPVVPSDPITIPSATSALVVPSASSARVVPSDPITVPSASSAPVVPSGPITVLCSSSAPEDPIGRITVPSSESTVLIPCDPITAPITSSAPVVTSGPSMVPSASVTPVVSSSSVLHVSSSSNSVNLTNSSGLKDLKVLRSPQQSYALTKDSDIAETANTPQVVVELISHKPPTSEEEPNDDVISDPLSMPPAPLLKKRSKGLGLKIKLKRRSDIEPTTQSDTKKVKRSPNAKKEHSVANAKKEHSIANAKKEHPIANAKKEHSVAIAKKEHSIANAKKEHPIANAKKEHSIANSKKEAPVAPSCVDIEKNVSLEAAPKEDNLQISNIIEFLGHFQLKQKAVVLVSRLEKIANDQKEAEHTITNNEIVSEHNAVNGGKGSENMTEYNFKCSTKLAVNDNIDSKKTSVTEKMIYEGEMKLREQPDSTCTGTKVKNNSESVTDNEKISQNTPVKEKKPNETYNTIEKISSKDKEARMVNPKNASENERKKYFKNTPAKGKEDSEKTNVKEKYDANGNERKRSENSVKKSKDSEETASNRTKLSAVMDGKRMRSSKETPVKQKKDSKGIEKIRSRNKAPKEHKDSGKNDPQINGVKDKKKSEEARVKDNGDVKRTATKEKYIGESSKGNDLSKRRTVSEVTRAKVSESFQIKEKNESRDKGVNKRKYSNDTSEKEKRVSKVTSVKGKRGSEDSAKVKKDFVVTIPGDTGFAKNTAVEAVECSKEMEGSAVKQNIGSLDVTVEKSNAVTELKDSKDSASTDKKKSADTAIEENYSKHTEIKEEEPLDIANDMVIFPFENMAASKKKFSEMLAVDENMVSAAVETGIRRRQSKRPLFLSDYH